MARSLTGSFTLGVILALCAPSTALAQTSAEPVAGGVQISRAELEQRLADYRQSAESSAYSSGFREIARQEAALIEERLTTGDFKVGDQIALQVEGEQALTGTYVVTNDRTIVLPVIGAIPLDGVLRAELQDYLTQELERYIRNPRVQARGLFRVTISGAVGKPGFYVVPAEAVLTDVLMTAGGPAGNAQLNGIRIEREGKTIWPADELQRAITEGRTLDQLSLAAGDHILVPAKSAGFFRNALYVISAVGSISYLLIRIF